MIDKVVLFFLLILILILSNDLFGYKENNTNITFIHIPKNAGTSIEYEGYKNGYIWGKYVFYNFNIIYYFDKLMFYKKMNYKINPKFNRLFEIIFNYNNKKQHIPYYIKKNHNKVSFMVVRNPYDKMLSNFKFLKTEKNINVFVKKYINLFKKRELPIRNYVYFIPQHEYLLDNTEVLKFENLDTDFKEFCKRHNLKKMTLQKINVSNNKDVANIKGLNAETIKLINDFYSKDFELFGYKKINPN